MSLDEPLLWRFLPDVRTGERSRFLFFAGLLMLISLGQTIGLAGTEALFLAKLGIEDLGQAFVAAAIFTTTNDLNAEFPAVAARQLRWTHVALMCGHEMAVPESQPRCIRALVLINTDKAPKELSNKYLKGAKNLRLRGLEV